MDQEPYCVRSDLFPKTFRMTNPTRLKRMKCYGKNSRTHGFLSLQKGTFHMTTFLPIDENSQTIQALRLKADGAQTINATTGASARNTTGFAADTKIVSLYATAPVYVRFGDNAVSAASTDHYYPSGIYYDFSIGGGRSVQYRYVSVRAVQADCTVYLSEKE